jgi:hypothetical protein
MITVGPDLDQATRNFTVGHEIGHALLFRATNGKAIVGEELERLCDLFASYLLAPIGYVDRQLRGPGPNLRSIREMAQSLEITERGLWLLISEHYPITFWWSRACHLDSIGPFQIEPFRTDIETAQFLATAPSRLELASMVDGVDNWVIEGMLDDEGAHGLLKPVGKKVTQIPSVKVINLSREQTLSNEIRSAETNPWTSRRK